MRLRGLLIVCVLSMAACQKQDASPQAQNVVTAKLQKSPAKDQVESQSDLASENASTQTPTNWLIERDPFRSYFEQSLKSRQRDAKLLLVNQELYDFRLVGIARDNQGAYALVEDPDKNGYTLRIGTRIGTRGGTVSQINKDDVVVREVQASASGKKTPVYRKLEFSP